MKLPAVFFLAFLLLAPCAVRAQEGLAMHGQPTLKDGFDHFPYADKDAPKGGVLRQSTVGSFDTLNPFTIKGKAALGLAYVYDRLMARSWDEPFTLYPLIAESVEVPEDRSSITFHLNKAARFSDGSPITTDDILYSFATLKEKGRPNMRSVYRLVDRVDMLDGHTLRFVLGKKHDRETVMILAMMPVLNKSYWSARPFDATTLSVPVTSGPYKIKSVEPGRRVTFERDADYWAKDLPVNKGLYNFDIVSTDYFRDDAVALEAFKKGDIDLRVEQDPGKWATAYSDDAGYAREEIRHGRVERMWGLIFNLRRAPFDDMRVRKALSLLIDYDWMNKNLFHGLYTPTASFYANSTLAATGVPSDAELNLLAPFRAALPSEVFGPAWTPAENKTPAQTRANLLAADILLKESGWIVRDGNRVDAKTGKPLTFEIILGSASDEKVALAFKRSLARLGILVSTRTLDSAAFNDHLISYDYDMTLYFWTDTLSPGTEQLLYWGCEAAKQKGRFNYSGLCLPAVDAIGGNIPQVQTREDLLTNVHALDRILTWEHIAIPLFYSGRDLVASWPRVVHPTTVALYGNTLESWHRNPSKTGK